MMKIFSVSRFLVMALTIAMCSTLGSVAYADKGGNGKGKGGGGGGSNTNNDNPLNLFVKQPSITMPEVPLVFRVGSKKGGKYQAMSGFSATKTGIFSFNGTTFMAPFSFEGELVLIAEVDSQMNIQPGATFAIYGTHPNFGSGEQLVMSADLTDVGWRHEVGSRVEFVAENLQGWMTQFDVGVPEGIMFLPPDTVDIPLFDSDWTVTTTGWTWTSLEDPYYYPL